MPIHSERRRVGEIIPAFDVETLAHGRLQVPGPGLIHLQFRRFAGCPVCNLRVRRFALRYTELSRAAVLAVSFFYSPREAMLEYQKDLPHPVVADPTRRFFDAFGVERSSWALADPRAWGTATLGMLSGPSNPLEGSAQDGLPADFLLAAHQARAGETHAQIVAAHYGAFIDDQWSVDDVLRLATEHPQRSSRAG